MIVSRVACLHAEGHFGAQACPGTENGHGHEIQPLNPKILESLNPLEKKWTFIFQAQA